MVLFTDLDSDILMLIMLIWTAQQFGFGLVLLDLVGLLQWIWIGFSGLGWFFQRIGFDLVFLGLDLVFLDLDHGFRTRTNFSIG